MKRARRGARAFLAGAFAAMLAGPAAGVPPRCEVSVELVPPRAFVGQQVHYRLRILRRRDVVTLDWQTALSFPTFRSEWLPGVASDELLARDGETWLEFLERRAIFPAHSGRLEVPAAALRCATSDGEEIVSVPRQELEVEPLPAAGQPSGFSGLIGPVTLQSDVSAQRLTLGGTLHLSVLLEGHTNVWAAESPRAALAAVPELDVFEQPAQLARDAGRELRLRQYWSFDLVPHRPGTLYLPELRLAYFDPSAGRYAEASARGFAIEVDDAPPPNAAPERLPEPAPPQPADPVERRFGPMLGIGLGLGFAVATGVLAAWLLRRSADRHPSHPLFARAAVLEEQGDREGVARELSRVLRGALSERVPGGTSASAEEMVHRTPPAGPAHTAALLLMRCEAAYFGSRDPLPAFPEIEAALRALRELPPLER